MLEARVLVIDDDADVREFLGDVLGREGVQVVRASGGRQGLALIKRQPVKVLFTALCMPDMDGLTVLRQAKQICPQLSAVVFAACATIESCVEAFRLGVCDYIWRPFTPPVILSALARALTCCDRKAQSVAMGTQLPRAPLASALGEGPDDPFVTRSAAMREACELAARIAPSQAAVLIGGETGVGKRQLARAIHLQSQLAGGAFVHVASGAIHESELDVRLFGQEAADFQGTTRGCQGLLEQANGGSVYLSQVERLPMWAQIRLFEAFQAGYVYRGSCIQPAPLDTRVIASTSCDLEAAVAEGRFYDGLYHLLNAIAIGVPPLRERQQDIRILIERCLTQTLARQGRAAEGSQCRFTPEAWECLLSHDWPGNLPELASAVVRAVAMTDGQEIGKREIVCAPRRALCQSSATITVPLAGQLCQIERHIVEEVIRRCRGNKAAAARVLGLHRRTLYRMLQGAVDETRPSG